MSYDKIEILKKISELEPKLTEEKLCHILKLKKFIDANASLKTIFEYGLDYLPNITNDKGQKDLNLLTNYHSDIINYFSILGECESIPREIRDLAIDFSIYSNGTSLEIDQQFYDFKPRKEIDSVFKNEK